MQALRTLARRLLPPPAKAVLRRTLPARWLPQEGFAKAYLRRMGVKEGTPLTVLQQVYVDFALSTNERGAWAAQVIQGCKEVRGSRCLDIGCAYGGFLVALGKLGATELVGTDVDEQLLKLGRINLEENDLTAKLELADIHDSAAMALLGKFDIVVSNDVLEHVADLPVAIENTCGLTAEGGVVYAVIPNKYFVRCLLKDWHYQLPGLTLLSYADAEAYHDVAMPGANKPYDVGHYRSFNYYMHHFRKHGMNVELFRSGLGVYDLKQLKDEFKDVRTFFETFRDSSLPPNIVTKIVKRARTVHDTFCRLIMQYENASSRDTPEAARLAEKILVRYGMEAWHIIARKVRA